MKTVILTEDQAVRPFAYEMIVGEQLPVTVLMKYAPDSADSDPHHAESYQRKFIVRIRLVAEAP